MNKNRSDILGHRTTIGLYALGLVTGAVFAAPQLDAIGFDIAGGRVIPHQPVATRVKAIGSAIHIGNIDYYQPATMKIELRQANGTTTTIEPFGAFDQPFQGNLNPQALDGIAASSTSFILPDMSPADVEITVTARSWSLKSMNLDGSDPSHWEPFRTRNSKTDPDWVVVLRDGDAVPPLAGWLDQASVKYYLRDYIDPDTDTLKLRPNDAIYLFELGFNMGPSYDLQDLVVLVSFADTPMGLADIWD